MSNYYKSMVEVNGLHNPLEEIHLNELAKETEESERISVTEALEESGMTLEECAYDSVVPACCSYGCMVEPDGECEHGHPSIFIEMGII